MPYRLLNIICVVFLSAVIFTAYYPALQADFLYWDDDTLLFENPYAQSLNSSNIKNIFTPLVMKAYIPLVTLSFAVEHYFTGLNPFLYHLDNIILHIVVTILIFRLILRLNFSTLTAFLTAFIFGMHPLHVESVAWVTERKDVLYAALYLLALHSYLSCLSSPKHKKIFYWLTIMLGFLSSLAKAMALSLPFILLLFDWKKGRKLELKLFTEKLPHLLYFLPIGWITYLTNNQAPVEHPWNEAFLTLIWTLTFYIKKFFLPTELTPLYDLPDPIHLSNPEILTGAIIFTAIPILLVRWRNHHFRWAVAFYFFSLFFLLKFRAHDLVVAADRYMYLPSLGFCLFLGHTAQQLLEKISAKSKIHRWVALLFFTITAVWMSAQTHRQVLVWQNDLSLWDYTITKNPDVFLAYNSRGAAYFRRGENDKALIDFNQAIQLNPRYANAYYNRGRVYFSLKNHLQAVNDFSNAVSFYPDFAKAYSERGLAFAELNKLDQALADYEKALTIDPKMVSAYNNRGLTFKRTGQLDKALSDFNHALSINPRLYQARVNRGNILRSRGENSAAIEEYSKALSINLLLPQAYLQRATAYAEERNWEAAKMDLKEYKNLGGIIDENYWKGLGITLSP
jgi:tetratricopeptide (TPR) repeat protein